jgi:hypothetical protein
MCGDVIDGVETAGDMGGDRAECTDDVVDDMDISTEGGEDAYVSTIPLFIETVKSAERMND